MRNLLKCIISVAIITLVFGRNLNGQGLKQTIRGSVYDIDSKIPLIGANVYIPGTDPILGAVTDLDGSFRIENVPVGRMDVRISSIGYEDKLLSNLLITSAKETVLQIELPESITQLEAAVVKVRKRKADVLNSMSTVSSKNFSVDETNRYAGSLNDPARMVSAYAGVTGNPEGNNDIVVRGNSPRYVLWRLEGVDIPNPNHFAENGSTGGPVSTLNPAMLSNSDFFTGAFAPEYGNALSGVFDVKYRKGNNENREYSFSAGVMGTDIAVEGPFKNGYNGSYLATYRYSTLDLLTSAGILDFNGIPRYQDASFNVTLPTKKLGQFSIFGLGGISNMKATTEDEDTEYIYGIAYVDANLGVLGVKHTYSLSDRSYLKSSVTATTAESGFKDTRPGETGEMYTAFKNSFREGAIRYSSTLNTKIDARLRMQTGVTLSQMYFDVWEMIDMENTGIMSTRLNSAGKTELLQLFTSWKYRMHKDVTLVAGLHYSQLVLNNNYAIEPRVALNWQFSPKQNLSFGFGVHSKVENIATYMTLVDGGDYTYRPNTNLELTKALHYVVGYGIQLNENLFFKSELYYQHLYNVPVENLPNSTFSIINTTGSFATREMVNDGTGRNYGVELSLERFYSNNFYYLFTTSLYKSRFTPMDGVERNTMYDANYAGNLVMGKEFKVGNGKKNKVIGINTKISFLGANRYTPIDLEASQEAGYTKYYEDQVFSQKGEDVFFINLGVTYRVDRKKTTHELKLDVTNITNNAAVVNQYYNEHKREIVEGEQLPLIPNIVYTIKF